MIQSPAEFVAMVAQDGTLAEHWRRLEAHPQYVEDRLYLTAQQWAAIREKYPIRPDESQAQAVWGVTVSIIEPGERIVLRSGKVLVYSKLLDSFYVFNESIARDAGLT